MSKFRLNKYISDCNNIYYTVLLLIRGVDIEVGVALLLGAGELKSDIFERIGLYLYIKNDYTSLF